MNGNEKCHFIPKYFLNRKNFKLIFLRFGQAIIKTCLFSNEIYIFTILKSMINFNKFL